MSCWQLDKAGTVFIPGWRGWKATPVIRALHVKLNRSDMRNESRDTWNQIIEIYNFIRYIPCCSRSQKSYEFIKTEFYFISFYDRPKLNQKYCSICLWFLPRFLLLFRQSESELKSKLACGLTCNFANFRQSSIHWQLLYAVFSRYKVALIFCKTLRIDLSKIFKLLGGV